MRDVGGDFNGHCGRNNSGKEETIGKNGVGESNEAGDNVVAFAMSHTVPDLGLWRRLGNNNIENT